MIKKKLFAILMAAFVVASVPVYADYTLQDKLCIYRINCDLQNT